MNNFNDFGQLEFYQASELFTLYAEGLFSGIAEDNFGTIASVGFDTHANIVYLQDQDYRRVAINNGILDLVIVTPSGEEGFIDHFLEVANNLSLEDVEYLIDCYKNNLSPEEIYELQNA